MRRRAEWFQDDPAVWTVVRYLQTASPQDRECSYVDCGRYVYALGMCAMHYMRERRSPPGQF